MDYLARQLVPLYLCKLLMFMCFSFLTLEYENLESLPKKFQSSVRMWGFLDQPESEVVGLSRSRLVS